jgi:hypothetical protein
VVVTVNDKLLEIAQHCRVLPDHTFDLGAAGEFRQIAERLEALAGSLSSADKSSVLGNC